MARISDDVKTFIVQALACYDSPSVVAAAVRETFGLDVDRRQIDTYRPERAGQKPAKRWIDLHEATRAAFLVEAAAAPIAHRAVRLRRLERLYERADSAKNYVLAAALLKQAAEEVGDSFTNRHRIDANFATVDLEQCTDEQLARIIAGEDPLKVIAQPDTPKSWRGRGPWVRN